MRKATISFSLSFSIIFSPSYLVFLPAISHSFSLTHFLLCNLMPLIIFQFSDIYLLFFEHYPWACSTGGECNGYGYPILILLCSATSHLVLLFTLIHREVARAGAGCRLWGCNGPWWGNRGVSQRRCGLGGVCTVSHVTVKRGDDRFEQRVSGLWGRGGAVRRGVGMRTGCHIIT